MNTDLLKEIKELNPWLANPIYPILDISHYIPRQQADLLLAPEWDTLCLILTGPRQAGKTTLGKFLCHEWLRLQRFKQLLYLNCDLRHIREWLQDIHFLSEITEHLRIDNYILFIDEVQRLENPGLLLKAIIDLQRPIKLLVSGSSQLEIKSKVQEFLTGRHLEALILPFGILEINTTPLWESYWLYGSYPQIIQSQQPEILLKQLHTTYIEKDIIQILQIQKPLVLEKLLSLVAHSSGQVINYQTFATDCGVTIPTIQNYLSILEKTYILTKAQPFSGNKRQELTGNPIYYFIDNGFRNQSLNNFSSITNRTDSGLLFQNWVFQEIYKFRAEIFKNFSIYYWRTKGGAEVDFILYKNVDCFIPVEVKFRQLERPSIPRGLRSFITAYEPTQAFIINKNLLHQEKLGHCTIYWIPYEQMKEFLLSVEKFLVSH